MSRKSLCKILAVVMAAAMFTSCGKPQSPPPIPVPTATAPIPIAPTKAPETVPATEEATKAVELPVVNDPSQMKYRTFGYMYCIHNDGTVSIRDDEGNYTKIQDPAWSDIVSVVYHDIGLVGLKADGTVVTTDPEHEEAKIMSQWENIVSLHTYSGYGSIIALNPAGEVFYAGDNPVITQWTGIVQLADSYYGMFGLKADGTVVSENSDFDLSSWTDVKQLAVGEGFLAGLRSDGTVLLFPFEEGTMSEDLSGWTDVVKISAYYKLLGLKADGTMLATETMYPEWMAELIGDLDFSKWKDLVDIYAWGASFIGLKADGTVLAAGMDEGGQLNVGKWKNIKALVVDNYTTLGLLEDGTLIQTVSEYDTESKEIVAFDVRHP